VSHADDLAQLREMPVEIELQGGEADGSRVWVPREMTTYLLPLQTPLAMMLVDGLDLIVNGPDACRPLPIRVAVYHWRGSIADDGARRFAFDGEQ
jgi:hypothetical protein